MSIERRPIGANQYSVLRAVKEHGCWYAGCGWNWNATHRSTQRLLVGLEKRHLVKCVGESYFITKAGEDYLIINPEPGAS